MAGAEIVVHFHREREAAEALAAQWKGRAIQADLASLGSIEAMFAELTQAGCRLDMLVNNAGIWKPSPLGDTAPSRLHELVDVNLKGPFWVMQCALPLLAEGARVVNISSVAARIGVA